MSKVSLAGLVFGLMILGILFFGIGFLAAVSTYGTKSDHPSWEQASQQQAAGPEKKGKPSALGKLGGAIGGSLIGQEATKIESRYGGGMLKGLTAAVPAPLKPFALQAQNQVSAEVQQTVNAGARDLKGTFTPSTYGSTPPPPPYHRAPSVTGQPPKPAFATPPASSAQLTQHGQHAPAQQHAQAQPFGAQAPAGGLGPAASQPMSTYSPPQQQMGQNTFYQQQQMAYQQQQNMAGMQPMGAPGMSGQPYSPNQPTQMMQPEARAYGSAPLAYAPPIYGAPSPQTQPGYQQGLAPNSYSANLQQPYTAPAGNMQQPYAYGAQPPHGYAPQPVQFVGMG